MRESIVFKPAHELARLIREGETSADAVIQAHLRWIQARNPELNAITFLDEEEACRQAQKADKALRQGRPIGPLHGVPFTMKEDPAPILRGPGGPYQASVEDSPCQKNAIAGRLQAAGAIFIGRSNAVYFPYGTKSRTNNPWDLARCPGVSSGGAAAALAAGLTPLDISNDTMGSILGPAHFCGVCGVRPTVGRISTASLPEFGPSILFRQLTVLGPMARYVTDLAWALQLIAGPDHTDSEVPPVPWREVAKPPLESLRIAWTGTIPGAAIDYEIQEAIGELARKLARGGAHLRRCSPDVDYTNQANLHRNLFQDLMLNSCGRPPDHLGIHSETSPLKRFAAALDERRQLVALWERFLETWDAFLLPACGCTAQRHRQAATAGPAPCDVSLAEEVSLPMRLAPATGHPALVFPISRDHRRLPIGAQLIGRLWHDEELLAIGEVIAGVAGGCGRPPLFE